MASIARPQSLQNHPDDTSGVCGLSWRRVLKIRNTVCWRWYYRFREEIPVEEFMSEGNQVIAESLNAFAPAGTGSFATFLFRALYRRMPSVARREWATAIEYSYDQPGKHSKGRHAVYRGPTLVDVPDDSAAYDDGVG